MDCTPAFSYSQQAVSTSLTPGPALQVGSLSNSTVNSSTPQSVSTLLTAGPGSPVASVSHLFQAPWVLTAPASARSWQSLHPPDSQVGPSGIPVSTASGVSITAGCCSAVSATSASGLSGLGPSVVPTTSASGFPPLPHLGHLRLFPPL